MVNPHMGSVIENRKTIDWNDWDVRSRLVFGPLDLYAISEAQHVENQQQCH